MIQGAHGSVLAFEKCNKKCAGFFELKKTASERREDCCFLVEHDGAAYIAGENIPTFIPEPLAPPKAMAGGHTLAVASKTCSKCGMAGPSYHSSVRRRKVKLSEVKKG